MAPGAPTTTRTEQSVGAARPGFRPTRPRRRAVALTVYAGLLVLWSLTIGLPSDPGVVLLWLWAATVAWNIECTWRYHLGFFRDWSLIIVGLVVYFLTRGLAPFLGIPVHYRMPIDVDRWLGGGTLPTQALQRAWCDNPCTSGDPHWWDVVFTTTYASHFLVGLTLAAVLYLRNRLEWARWMRRYLVMNYAGLLIYLTYPMSPPWLASEKGMIEPTVHRITGKGWSDLGLERTNLLLAGLSNPTAAMPSLHAGIALLVAAYGVQRLHSRWRWLLLLYPLVMGTALVYFAEHYVIDLIAGWALALVVLAGCQWWETRRGGPGRDAGQR